MANERRTGRRLLEDLLKFRVRPRPDGESQLHYDDALVGDDSQAFSSALINIDELSKFRSLADNREYQYQSYDSMKSSPMVAAALDLYADDATQYDSMGRIIWVESDNPDIVTSGNRLLRILNIASNAWSHIYSLCTYGDLYLELFWTGKDKSKLSGEYSVEKVKGTLEEYIEAVDNPSEMFDLQHHGKSVGYLRVPTRTKEESMFSMSSNIYEINDSRIIDPRKYVHIYLANHTNRNPERVKWYDDESKKGSTNEDDYVIYKVLRGKSVLHDAYKLNQELSLLEDTLLLNRVSKSAIIRLLQVEVGDMPKGQVQMLLRRIKNLVEQKTVMNSDTGSYKSIANPGPADNAVYIPTRNGKGSITTQTIGGDPDVKSILDIEYFRDSLAGVLKIPKQFLGYTGDAAGFDGGQSLTKLSSRYARTIKRIQTAYLKGITEVLNTFFKEMKLDQYINQFTVRMVSPSTTEDAERDEALQTKADITGRIMDLVADYDDVTKRKVLKALFSGYLSQSEISEILTDAEDDQVDSEDESTSDDKFDEIPGEFSDEEFIDIPSDEVDDIESVGSTPDQATSFGDFEKLG